MSFLGSAQMDAVGVFGYSDEDGTEAVGLGGKLDESEIRARVTEVSDVVDEVMAQRAEQRIGHAGRGPRGARGRDVRRGSRGAPGPRGRFDERAPDSRPARSRGAGLDAACARGVHRRGRPAGRGGVRCPDLIRWTPPSRCRPTSGVPGPEPREARDVEPGAGRDRLGAAVEPAQHAHAPADRDDPVLLVPADVRRRRERRDPGRRDRGLLPGRRSRTGSTGGWPASRGWSPPSARSPTRWRTRRSPAWPSSGCRSSASCGGG